MEQSDSGTANPVDSFKRQLQESAQVAKDLLPFIDSIRSKDIDLSQKALLYRALTGPMQFKDGKTIFQGSDLGRLKKYGMFENNGSSAQFSRNVTDREFETRVPGLPVFANLEEAIGWLHSKVYINKPTLSLLDAPLSVLYGDQREAILKRNGTGLNMSTWEVPQEEMRHHIQQNTQLSGECYLAGADPKSHSVPNSIRQYELFLQPSILTPEGKIDFPSGFQKLELPVE